MLLLAPPCWLLSNAYQRLLAGVLQALLELSGKGVSVYRLQVYAPFDLVLFTAMCLASRRAAASARWRALLLGLPILVVIEVLVVLVAALPALLVHGEAMAVVVPRFTHYTIQTIVWVTAPLLWLVLLGAAVPARQPAAAPSALSEKATASVCFRPSSQRSR